MEIFNSWLVNKYISYHGMHSKDNTENSLSAIKDAIAKDYALLLSIRVIGGGTPVVFYDETLKHSTGKDGYLSSISSTDSLKEYKLNGSNQHIITLAEALKAIGGKTPVILEVRNFGQIGVIEENIAKILKNYKGAYAVASYNPHSLFWFKENCPDMLRGQMSCYFKGEEIDHSLNKHQIRKLKQLKYNAKVSEPNFIIYDSKCLPNRFVNKIKDIPVLANITESQQEYIKIAKHCDNIIFKNFEPHI